jgi:hypothetical protein
VIVSTDRYTDRWGLFAFAAPLLVIVLMVFASSRAQTAWQGVLEPRQGLPHVASPTFSLPAGRMNGFRLRASASLPLNKWAALNLRLVDQQGNVLLDLVKEAWRESGTWHEGGESGSYDESDVALEWPARVGQTEQVHLEAGVLDMGDSVADEPGTVLDPFRPHNSNAPPTIPMSITVRTRTSEGTLFLLAFLVSAGLATLAYHRAGHGGVPVVVERAEGSEVRGPPAEMGGPARLVTVAVSGAISSSGPDSVEIEVRVRHAVEREVHRARREVETWRMRQEGSRHFWTHFHLELPRGRYQITVRARPSVESMKLLVRDGNSTRGEVEVTRLGPEVMA